MDINNEEISLEEEQWHEEQIRIEEEQRMAKPMPWKYIEVDDDGEEMSLEDKLWRAKLMPWQYDEETGEIMNEAEREAKRHKAATRIMMEKAINPKGSRY